MRKLLLSCISFMLLTSCGRKPDEPGKCSLNCSEAIITSPGEYVIESMTQGFSFAQPVSAPTEATFEVYFRVKQVVGGVSDQGLDEMVPYISVDPLIFGATRVTPDEELCSDQCGLISIAFSATLSPDGPTEGSIAVKSGSLFSEPITFTVDGTSEEE
jgi:hypothetical protein